MPSSAKHIWFTSNQNIKCVSKNAAKTRLFKKSRKVKNIRDAHSPLSGPTLPRYDPPINVKLSDHCGHCAHRFAHPWTMH